MKKGRLSNSLKNLMFIITFILTTIMPYPAYGQHDHSNHKHDHVPDTKNAHKAENDFWTCSMHPQIKLPKAGQCPICKMDLIPIEREIEEEPQSHTPKEQARKVDFWTCSMHPQIKLPKKGSCPICKMDLIPVYQEEDTDSSGPRSSVSLKLSPTAEKLAEIETTKVERKAVVKQIRLAGQIDYDETRLTHITAWVPGRIDRMYVDFTGIHVRKGDHMVELFSPELISAQEELIQGARSLRRLSSSVSNLVTKSTQQAVRSAREKLELLGLTSKQVKEIERRGKAQDKVTIYAPTGGIVVERNATEGMYVKVGTHIYSIADLSLLWVHLDAYESDLPWIKFGQKMSFTTKAQPGVEFEGTVSFISPVVNPKTRTTKVRVNISNADLTLKPGLFVSGIIEASPSEKGLLSSSLAGKYVGPMHPEIVRDEPGKCPLCGMNLVLAEELPYQIAKAPKELPIVIPDTAPLVTGKRAVVYVKEESSSRYHLRRVVLGPKVSGHYIVKDGLAPGELVVTNGAFKIDADLQIKGKESMMSSGDSVKMSGHTH